MDIGKTLKIYRVKNELTQKQLAELLECSVVTLSSIEKGKRKPSIDILAMMLRKEVLTKEDFIEYGEELLKNAKEKGCFENIF